MLHTSIAHAINKQIIVELSAQMTYLSMAAWLEAKSLKGFAKWFKKQADEEHEHAMKFYHFVLDRGGFVTLTDIPVAQSVWKTPLKTTLILLLSRSIKRPAVSSGQIALLGKPVPTVCNTL